MNHLDTTPHGGFFAFHGIWAPGVRLFRNLSFSAKAVLVSFTFLPLMALLVWTSYEHEVSAWQTRQQAVRQEVEVARGILAWAHDQERQGGMDRDRAQTLAKSMIASLRYGNGEYFWINDMTPTMVMHPIKPELDGRNLRENKDPNGFPLFSEMVRIVARDGHGPITYQWPKPTSDTPVDKVSYVMGFEPWGWIIGSGVYADDLAAAAREQRIRVVAVCLTVLLLAMYAFMSFYKVMNGGLKETRRHLLAMTAGDLTTSPNPWGRDEAAELMLDMKAMQDALRSIVTDVRTASDTIVTASTEIAGGATDLSARTESTAASLEQAAASMEEISGTARTSADTALRAAEIAQSNTRSSSEAGGIMSRVVVTMNEIAGASSKIQEIIGTIDGIAFQTNILALNAAVEAARAGDQGRGFAVVASEVRVLAQRSADAARQIKGLIQDSVGRAHAGTEVVRDAGRVIGQTVSSAAELGLLIEDIARGAREQSGGMAQIGAAVAELDRSTQQNAALVEETAAATASLNEHAHALAGRVARFRLR